MLEPHHVVQPGEPAEGRHDPDHEQRLGALVVRQVWRIFDVRLDVARQRDRATDQEEDRACASSQRRAARAR
jgi:hypothetical protein